MIYLVSIKEFRKKKKKKGNPPPNTQVSEHKSFRTTLQNIFLCRREKPNLK